MSMHLHHPSLSWTGKKKGKHKFRNADEARLSRDLAENWDSIQKKYPAKVVTSGTISKRQKLVIPAGRSTNHIPSLNTGKGTGYKIDAPVYTGSQIKGLGTMHKSNIVPIFSDAEAIDIARMRR